ncbi:hypothetical protein AND4_00608 [Vibrio sp. AND4]|nr:hypothetical protein AND4_00608 [Vibrio sp. AND4]
MGGQSDIFNPRKLRIFTNQRIVAMFKKIWLANSLSADSESSVNCVSKITLLLDSSIFKTMSVVSFIKRSQVFA